MARQPDNILLTFENIDTLSGNNFLKYYYREGVVYVDGGENLFEFKRLALTNEQLSRTTRLVDGNHSGQTYRTEDGNNINLLAGEELYVSHNYTGDLNLDKEFNTNSWWYDVNWHKSYRVYLVVTFSNQQTINGEVQKDYRIKETFTIYKGDQENDNDGTYTFLTKPEVDIGITASIVLDQKYNGNTWETANLALYYNNSVIADEELDLTTVTLPERMTILVDYAQDAIEPNDQLKIGVSVADSPNVHDDALLVTEYTMSISSESDVDAPETILGFNENLGLNRDFDCQPTLNNGIVSRQSKFVQDVDYSISSDGLGIFAPQNLSLLLSNKATKATVPDSNYSQYSQIIPKYYGTKTNRTGVNLSSPIPYNFQQVNASTNPSLPLSPFYFTIDNLGSFPNVESKNSYIGYFEKIIDPYPVLNGKTAYFVKYLIDENTDVLDPSITVQGLNNLKNTFKQNDLNNLPTSVKASIQNIDEARELKDLENFATVYKVAEFPSPILFSQTSSTGYANTIQMTGSGTLYVNNVDLDPDKYKNLAFIATDTVLSEKSTQNQSFDGGQNIITSLGNDEVFAPEDTTLIGEPNQNVYSPQTGEIIIDPDDTLPVTVEVMGIEQVQNRLTDDYKIYVDYNFYTSHIPPIIDDNGPAEEIFGSFIFTADTEVINAINIAGINDSISIDKVELTAWKPSDPSNLAGPHVKGEGQSVTVNLEKDTVYAPSGRVNREPIVQNLNVGSQIFPKIGGRINFDSTQIYSRLRQIDPSGFPEWLVTGTRNDYNIAEDSDDFLTNPDRNNYIDYFKGAYLQWKVRLVKEIPEPGTGYKLKIKRRGSIDGSTYGRKSDIQTFNNTDYPQERVPSTNFTDQTSVELKHYLNATEGLHVDVIVGGETLEENKYTITYNNNSTLTVDFGGIQRTGRVQAMKGYYSYRILKAYRCFNPPGIQNVNLHYLKFSLLGLKTPSAENLGIANAPYFDFVNASNRSRIYLVPPLLNNNYGSGYYQSPSPYTASINTAFPFSIEPSYTSIPTPTDPLEFFPGDQIRFVNLESEVYTIISVSEGTVDGNQRIILNLDKDITVGINLDFFLIRRFKPANNFVILDQQKPYGLPPLPSSAPGILQTQFQNQELETNPDKVITNLIERNLI